MLDIPHILVLFDDSEDELFSLLENESDNLPLLYNFDLPENAGHLEGRLVSDEKLIDRVSDFFVKLKTRGDFLFAVGDGNHSLGAAKQLWEQIKASGEDDVMNHPARWAMVELENIHDKGLNFEPIHRVLFNVNREEILKALNDFSGFSTEIVSDGKILKERVDERSRNGQQCIRNH